MAEDRTIEPESMRERIAWAMCYAAGIDPDRKGSLFRWRWQEFLTEADAVLEELARGPTTSMVTAALPLVADPGAVLTAMVKAAQADAPYRVPARSRQSEDRRQSMVITPEEARAYGRDAQSRLRTAWARLWGRI